MKLKKLALLACTYMASYSVAPGQQGAPAGPVLTLSESVNIALQNNLQVRQSGLQSQSAAIELKQSRRDLLPSLSGSVGHGFNQGRSIDPFTNAYIDQNVSFANYGLTGGLTLFNGLLLQNTIKQKSLAYEASKMEQEQARDLLTLNVMLTYLQALSNEELFNQAVLRADISRQQVKRLEVLDKEGAIAPALLFDLEGQLANDELTIINSRNALKASRLALSQLMNVDYDPGLKLSAVATAELSIPGRYPFDADEIILTAMKKLAMIKGATLRRMSAAKGVQASRSAMYPTLSLNSNLFSNYSSLAYRNEFTGLEQVTSENYINLNGTQYPVVSPERRYISKKINYNDQLRNNFSSSFSINLRIPIFNSVFARTKIAQAKVELQNAELVEETSLVQLRQAIEQAYFNMEASRERYEAVARQVEAYKKAFAAAEVRFNAGAGTSVDYSVARNNFDQASISLVNVKYDFVLRTRILDYYRGELLLE